MPRSAKRSAATPKENPLVPNTLLLALDRTMRAMRAAPRSNVRGEEALRASILLLLREGDLICDLATQTAGQGPRPKAAPPWLELRETSAARGITMLLGGAGVLRAQAGQSKGAAEDRPLLVVLLQAAALSRQQWRQALETASQQSLPMVFVTRPAASGTAGALSDSSQAHGVPGIPVDAVDAVALCRVLGESMLRARHGDGPTLIESMHWRLAAKQEDPLRRHTAVLRSRGLVPSGRGV